MSFPSPSEKQARLIWLAASGLAIAVLVLLLVALIWGLGKVLNVLGPVLWPIAVAGVFAYLLDPVVDWIERRGAPRTRAILCVFALAVGLVVALGASVIPQAVVEARQLAGQVPAYAANLKEKVERWVSHPPKPLEGLLRSLPLLPKSAEVPAGTNVVPATAPLATNVPPRVDATNGAAGDRTGAALETLPIWQQLLGEDSIQSASGWLAGVLPQIGTWLFGQVTKVASWFGVLASLALVPVYLFYFLLEKRGIQARWTDYLPIANSQLKDELVFVLSSINNYLIAFFRGQVLVAMCDGILYAIGFTVIGLPYAILIGLVAMVLTVIPFIGAFLTCGSALIIAVVQSGHWLQPLLVLAVFGVVQALEGLVIQPRIMGDRVGLHPVSIIIALMIGTTLFGGILGGILAIPLTAGLRVIMFRYVWNRRRAATGEAATGAPEPPAGSG